MHRWRGLSLLLALAVCGSCSDDTTPSSDANVADLAGDLAAPDQALPDQTLADGAAEDQRLTDSARADIPPKSDTAPAPCNPPATAETFATGDEPYAVQVGGQSVNTPWGYDRAQNATRSYPLVVHGCWGHTFNAAVKKQYPHFALEYQKCSSDSEGTALAAVVDAVVAKKLRVDTNRIYYTGFSKGGSGSYKLVRGFLSGGHLFAGLVRMAGQSESTLAAGAVPKTSIWYHIGLKDTAQRVKVARDAYAFIKNHALNQTATESTDNTPLQVGGKSYVRTTKTLTKGGVEIMKLTEFPDLGHSTHSATYADPEVYRWLFAQSLTCR